jgi:predicted nucleotidyltransferase
MRTSVPSLLPLFRSEMQVRLLALLLLQPQRRWTLHELADAVGAPQSSVHRELSRAEGAGVISRDNTARPHRFVAATDAPVYPSLADLLRRTVGVENELRVLLDRPDVAAAVIHGSWASGATRPDSDIDVLVVGDATLRELRRVIRGIERSAGRGIDLTLMREDEFRRLLDEGSSFAKRVVEEPLISLVGDLGKLADR